ncbi:MAG TPA: hypothetical protein VIN93_01630, partial [Bryobacteraceae bacterium]
MADIVRVVANMNIAPNAAQDTASLSGTADQVALAEWLLNQLDRPAPSSHEPAAYDYQTGKRDSVVRVFRLAQIETTRDLQEIDTAIRTMAAVRVVISNAQRALVMRGTADSTAVAEWLVNELDQPR